MDKELEALERIKNIPLYHMEQDIDETYDGTFEYSYHEEYDGKIKDICPREINIIEVALKRLEVIDNSVKFDMEYYEKRNQALEIIINKNVNIQTLTKGFWIPHHYIFCTFRFL